MRVWQAAVLINLALALGIGLGYAGWGRRAEALGRNVDAVHARLERVERERAACAAGARGPHEQWDGRGVVRAVYPRMVVITHEEIRGLLPARTTSFPAAPGASTPVRVGDPIRFSLRGTVAADVVVVAIEPW